MGGSGAKHRGKRQIQRKKAADNSVPSMWGPAFQAQALQGWQSLSNRAPTSTLMQEARNTEHHGFAWGNSTRLRDNRVQFVSAGNLGMTKSDSEEGDVDGDDPNEIRQPETADLPIHVNLTEVPANSSPVLQGIPNVDYDHKHTAITNQVERMEIVAEPLDSCPVTSTNDVAEGTNRARSPSTSLASEEEVIVFGGRKGEPTRPMRPASPPPIASVPVIENETAAVENTKLHHSPGKDFATSAPNSVFGHSAAGSSSENLSSAKKVFLQPNPNFGRRRGRTRKFPDHDTDTETQSPAATSSPNGLPSMTEAVPEPNPNFGRRRGRSRKFPNQETDTETRSPVAPSSPGGLPSTTEAVPEPKPNFGRRRDRRMGLTRREIEEEALIQDYIANMGEEETDKEDAELLSGRNGHLRSYDGVSENDVKVQALPSGNVRLPNALNEDFDWSSGDLEDFDGMSTTDDEIAEVGCVFADRLRPSGFQYLVTAVGKGLSDACWVHGEALISTTATTQIHIFESRRESKLDPQNDAVNDSSTDSDADGDLDDLKETLESEEDENERLLQRTARMTDAQIAQALDMQERLGMATNEVLLFTGEEDDGFANNDDFIPFTSKQQTSHRTRSKRSLRKKDNFPSAEALADALDQDPYNGFDVMDFDRPSLRPKRKGRKSAGLPFELEDEELAFQLQQSWENDRSKKASKKREREEMRQAGLLGSRGANGRVDLHTKYQESGMDADQIRTEIRSFMVQEIEALALAPMAADMRASVHLLARALNMKSHSQGKGDGRFPVLTKTSQTPHYHINNVSDIDALLNQRKFFPRNRGSVKPGKLPRGERKMQKSGGGGILAGASYMDGDVVGASAPEIGVENRGRAMLEKMGWSNGMGIGKVGNKGSTEVIKHVVKNTKAGLG